MIHRFLAIGFVFLGLGNANVHAQAPSDVVRPVLRVVYFIPTDRQAEPDRVERLDRVLTEVQRFYREGMKQNGYGPLTFELERDRRGALKLHTVQAKGPMRDYGRNSAAKVRREVKESLARDGLDIDRETIIIFQLLLEWQGDKAVEVGPFVGGGSAHSGTGWAYDDAKLDPKLLASKEPGGYYHGPCSLGKFNTHYIGGVIHELGHGLSLPHERERDGEQPRRGNSLMGAGNHTYGQELRGEGRGTFLTAASALPLSLHPLFTGQRKPSTPLTCQVAELAATPATTKMTLAGRLEGGPRVVGLVAYNDPQETPGDYDAIGWTSPVDAAGKFRVEIEDLKPGRFELRLRALGEAGDSRQFAYHYSVDRDGTPDVAPLLESPLLRESLAAFRAKNSDRLADLARAATRQTPANSTLTRKLAHLQTLLAPATLPTATQLPPEVKAVKVADVELESSSVGWGKPFRNQVLPEGEGAVFLEVGGTFFESGLYAHAPARHVVRVARGWKTFASRYGLQDGHDGSVVFVVRGDGKELFRSPTVRDAAIRPLEVDIANVGQLELIVEDAGDGTGSDWGVWLDSELRR